MLRIVASELLCLASGGHARAPALRPLTPSPHAFVLSASRWCACCPSLAIGKAAFPSPLTLRA
jgi:hypothetical protein